VRFIFNLPEFDIKALYKNRGYTNFQSQFQMSNCKGKRCCDFLRAVLAKTPYDDVYSSAIRAYIHEKNMANSVANLYIPFPDEKC